MPPQTNSIDYAALLEQYPWIRERGRQCILSPDSDGFLCALLATSALDWSVAGFYDGKVLIAKDGIDYRQCVFLDMEVNRPGIGSIGNHMVDYNLRLSESIENRNFEQCIQPNALRGFDGKGAFRRKYPFATIHLLLGLLQEAGCIAELPGTAASPLLFVDGVMKNLFNYPENCLDWINFLKIDRTEHILHGFLCETDANFYRTMQRLRDFYRMLDQHGATGYFDGEQFSAGGKNKRTGHKIVLSDKRGEPINLVRRGSAFDLHEREAQRAQGCIAELGAMTGLPYRDGNWNWTGFRLVKFRKGLLGGGGSDRLNNGTFKDLFQKNPFSLAMTATDRIEYTLEDAESD